MTYRQVFCLSVLLLCPSSVRALTATPAIHATELLKTNTTWDGAPLTYHQGKPEVTALMIEIAPGAETGWHEHPMPSFEYILQGNLEVTLANGTTKHLKAGDTFLEVINTQHNGRNVGKIPVKILVFYAGTTGQPLRIPQYQQYPKNNQK